MTTTRNAIVLNITTDNPVLEIDPLPIENNGNVGSAWDANLIELTDCMMLAESEDEDRGVSYAYRLAWEDDLSPVLIECPGCGSIRYNEVFMIQERTGTPEVMMCDDCWDE